MDLHKREYAAMVEKQREHLYRLAYCYVKNQQDALDIVGESVYRGLLHLKPGWECTAMQYENRLTLQFT